MPYFINIPAGCASGPSVQTKRQISRPGRLAQGGLHIKALEKGVKNNSG